MKCRDQIGWQAERATKTREWLESIESLKQLHYDIQDQLWDREEIIRNQQRRISQLAEEVARLRKLTKTSDLYEVEDDGTKRSLLGI